MKTTTTTNTQKEKNPFMERIKLSAKNCPEEYRPAYAHLLGALWKETEDLRETCELSQIEETEIDFRRGILLLLVKYPAVSPFFAVEIVDKVAPLMPQLEQFRESLRMLSELRQREFV